MELFSDKNELLKEAKLKKIKAFELINISLKFKPIKTTRILYFSLIAVTGFLFLPWTQNVNSQGEVTTLTPNDRPQELPSIIEGKIVQWYIKEGDYVNEGDTIVYISEIKDEYWDPNLLKRTQEQIEAKEGIIMSYSSKVGNLESLINTERVNLDLKLAQAKSKVRQAKSKIAQDSAEVQAAMVSYKISQEQAKRGEEMYEKDLLSLIGLEKRRNDLQGAAAKLNFAENKLSIANNELINALIEINAIESEYTAKILKIQSDIQSTNSELFKGDEELSKLNNQYSNYKIRQGNYYVIAPNGGQVVSINKQGVGEIVKPGESIASISPANPNLAVALYFDPVDLPLIRKGETVRIIFDGWPVVIFDGWPGVSYGTFAGLIAVIDNNISSNGKYRVLVAPDDREQQWPKEIRVGAGAKGVALLNNVSIWYEIWRQLSGFPPDFYVKTKAKSEVR